MLLGNKGNSLSGSSVLFVNFATIFARSKRKRKLLQALYNTFKTHLRWPEPIYMRVGYVFDLRFSEWKIQPISMIFGIFNK